MSAGVRGASGLPQLGDLGPDAPALEEEALLGIDRTDGARMAALDVVGLDLEVRHRLGPRVVGQLDDPVGLVRVRALAFVVDTDHAGVDGVGTVVERPLEQQVGRGVARFVRLEGAEVVHLVAVAEVQGRHAAGGATADEAAVEAIAGVVTAERDMGQTQRRLLADRGTHGAQLVGAGTPRVDRDQADPGGGADGDLDTRNSIEVMNLLLQFNNLGYEKDNRKPVTMIMATHNPDIEVYADRILYIKDGQIQKQVFNTKQWPLDHDMYLAYLKTQN